MHWIKRASHWSSSCCKAASGSLYIPKCSLCGALGTESICEECLAEMTPADAPQHPFLVRTSAAFEYIGRASQAVKHLKYGGGTSLAEPMADLLRERYVAEFAGEIDFIIPVPIHWTRRNERGYNQAELLAASLPSELDQTALLQRTHRTRAQASLDRSHRLQSLRGAFRASPEAAGKRVLLVDDVVTTGATLEACSIALRKAGAREISALCFAAVP